VNWNELVAVRRGDSLFATRWLRLAVALLVDLGIVDVVGLCSCRSEEALRECATQESSISRFKAKVEKRFTEEKDVWI